MSLRNSGTRLAMLTKELMLKWKDTRESWKDAKSGEFERKYLDELQGSVDNAVTVIDKLDKLISKIRKDCE
jgi:thymidylate synthase